MPETHTIQVIARIKTDFSEKFGIPRQSGLVQDCKALVVFEPEFRNPDALRGLEDFSHIWLIWQFSQAVRPDWSPTVRPPRLGGNRRLGVFATRSPFRPNPIGLSCVRLAQMRQDRDLGPVLVVAGADLAVDCSPALLDRVPEDKRAALLAVLAQDPRPQYQDDPDRVYGMAFAGLEVKFQVAGERLTVTEIS